MHGLLFFFCFFPFSGVERNNGPHLQLMGGVHECASFLAFSFVVSLYSNGI